MSVNIYTLANKMHQNTGNAETCSETSKIQLVVMRFTEWLWFCFCLCLWLDIKISHSVIKWGFSVILCEFLHVIVWFWKLHYLSNSSIVFYIYACSWIKMHPYDISLTNIISFTCHVTYVCNLLAFLHLELLESNCKIIATIWLYLYSADFYHV